MCHKFIIIIILQTKADICRVFLKFHHYMIIILSSYWYRGKIREGTMFVDPRIFKKVMDLMSKRQRLQHTQSRRRFLTARIVLKKYSVDSQMTTWSSGNPENTHEPLCIMLKRNRRCIHNNNNNNTSKKDNDVCHSSSVQT